MIMGREWGLVVLRSRELTALCFKTQNFQCLREQLKSLRLKGFRAYTSADVPMH